MAIAHKEVWIELGKVERDLTNPMRAVDTREDTVLFAQRSEALERHADSRKRDNGIEDCEARVLALLTEPLDCFFEGIAEVVVTNWVGVFDLVRFCGRGLDDVAYSLLAGSVDRRKVNDDILRLPDDVAKHSVDANRCIVHKDTGLDRSMQVLRHCFPRDVELLRVLVSNEGVRTSL